MPQGEAKIRVATITGYVATIIGFVRKVRMQAVLARFTRSVIYDVRYSIFEL